MNEIYWITRLDSIVSTSEILFGFGFIIGIFSFVFYTINRSDDNDKWITFWKKGVVIGLVTMFIFGIIRIFVPTSKDAMLILGVGGTIDYIKSNETIQKIPDKCINALDAWVDSLNEENKEE